MADYMQQRILDALEAALVAAGGSGGWGNRVFVDRVDALQPGELPAILIEAGEETVDFASPSGNYGRQQRQRRDFNVLVCPCAAHNDEAGKQLRAMCKEIELAIFADAPLNDLARDVPRLLGSKTSLFGEGTSVLAQQPMAWSFPYFTLSNQPDAPA
ncbi:MAG TPA: hypothetical protein VEA40_07455 [Ramlibacter sp.]|nr:hypothetical protein [Ramlibacter sp.]